MTLQDRPDFVDQIAQYVKGRVDKMAVCRPARVRAWSADTGDRATVQPIIRRSRRNADGVLVHYLPPPIYNCPVAWPGGGDYSITWPLAAGNTGMVLFSDDAIDEWLLDPGDDVPTRFRRHHAYADAIFVPGLRPFDDLDATAVDPDGMVIAIPSSKRLYLGADGLTSASELAYRASVQTALDAIETLLTTWTVVPNDGGAALRTAALALTWPTVAGTTKTRAE